MLAAVANPRLDILGHMTGRKVAAAGAGDRGHRAGRTRPPSDFDLDKVLAACVEHGKAIEINSSPQRLDLKDLHARRAAELGVPIAINTDTHYLENLDNMALGIATANRAWITAPQVLNTLPLKKLLTWAHASRP